jgi:hypothetical protein
MEVHRVTYHSPGRENRPQRHKGHKEFLSVLCVLCVFVVLILSVLVGGLTMLGRRNEQRFNLPFLLLTVLIIGIVKLINPQPSSAQGVLDVAIPTIDFGSVLVGETAKETVTVKNAGKNPLTITGIVSSCGMDSGFFIPTEPFALTLLPGTSFTFEIAFRPNSPSAVTSACNITITSNGGNATIVLRGRGIETTPPAVRVISPIGGERIQAGKPTAIAFSGEDNDQLTAFIAAYSTDGGISFTDIGIVSGTARSIIWNVPADLKTDLALIRVIALDRSGNRTPTVSGLLDIEPSLSSQLIGRSLLTFDPPFSFEEPPVNLRVSVSGDQCGSPDNLQGNEPGTQDLVSVPEGLIGYNIYRVRQAPDGTVPDPEEIAREENLVGSVQADKTIFSENILSDKISNFCYSISAFYAGVGTSRPSSPTCSDFPILRNPIIRNGVLFFDAAGTFIKPPAQLIFNDKEAFDLKIDSTGAFFFIPLNARSVPSGIKLKKFLKKWGTVQIRLRLSDGTCYPV